MSCCFFCACFPALDVAVYVDGGAVSTTTAAGGNPMGNSMGGKCSTMTCAECAGKHKKCKARTMGRWVRLQTSGRPPSPRSGHDVAVIGNKVRKRE